MTEKENFIKMYKHEKPDHLPNPAEGLLTFHPIMGFLERPDDGGDKDWFGVKYVFEPGNRSGVPDPYGARVVSDITKWRDELKIPDVANWDWKAAAEKDKVAPEVREKKLYSLLIQCGIWERYHSLLGMEAAYISLMEEPEASADLINALGEYKYQLFSKIIEYYKPDVIRQHDDYGTQISMQMSPEIWRKLIKPHIKRYVELCHSHGIFYEQHSCGFIEEIVPDLAEVGVDSWQGMHINDVVKLKKKTGNKIVYHMGLNMQKYTLLDATKQLDEAKLREDVRTTVLSCAEGGCYFPAPVAPGGWWGNAVIADEIVKCRETIKY